MSVHEPGGEARGQTSSDGESQVYSTEAELPLLGRPLRPLVDLVARIRVSVHAKLLAGFLILALLLLGMGILSLVVISRMNDRVGELSVHQEEVNRAGQALYLVTAQSHFRAMALVCELVRVPSTESPNDCTADPAWNDRIASAKEGFAEQVDALNRISPADQDEFFRRIREENRLFAISSQRALNLYEAGDIGGALNAHIAEEHEMSHELEAALNGVIRDSSAETAQASAAFRSDRDVLTTVVVIVSGVSLLSALSLGFVFSWAFIRPVRRINYMLGSIARGDFTRRVEVPNRDEFGTLSRSLNHTSGQLARLYGELQSLTEELQRKVDEQVEELRREVQQRERIEQEMRVAHDIQLAFLPKQTPDLPGWQVATHYQPARAVGGDFYDFIDLPDRYQGIVVGDVSDKGVPAALVMCATRSMIRAASLRLNSPAQVLEQVNEVLYDDIPPNMFVTCLYAILDMASGRLHYSNAGHNLPYLRTKDGVIELRATGMPLGLMPGMTYEDKTVDLAPGDSVLFHSDGLVEAHNPDRQMFGFPRLADLVEKHPGGAQLIDGLLAEMRRFTGADWEQEDDVTLVTLQRSSNGTVEARASATVGRANPTTRKGERRKLADFTLPSEPGNEREAMRRVASAVQGLRLPAHRLERLKTAVAEATMNAMEHGNKYRADLPVSIRVLASGAALSVEITDHGGSEPIPEPQVPDLEAKLAGTQPPRGWGLFLIKNMVDDMCITSDETHHTVELVLKLEGDGRASESL